MGKKLTEEQILAIEDILNSGGSNRGAAREVLGSESRESTIRVHRMRGDIIVGGDSHKELVKEGQQGPKILTIDIETAPLLASLWRMFKQTISLNMIQQDWYILSFCAKWAHEDHIIYRDKRDSYDSEDDTKLLDELWDLLNEADIVVGQNSVRFDTKKINSRFILNDYKPPSRYRQVDTLMMAKRHFGFTSNKLEYMTDKICTRYKKQTHQKYAGFELWKECLAGNVEAWLEMETYNIYDVLSTEELYFKMAPWSNNHPNINVYTEGVTNLCSSCGEDDWSHNGYAYTNLSKFDKFRCNNCGQEQRGRVNLLSKEKRKSLKANITY